MAQICLFIASVRQRNVKQAGNQAAPLDASHDSGCPFALTHSQRGHDDVAPWSLFPKSAALRGGAIFTNSINCDIVGCRIAHVVVLPIIRGYPVADSAERARTVLPEDYTRVASMVGAGDAFHSKLLSMHGKVCTGVHCIRVRAGRSATRQRCSHAQGRMA